MKILISSRRGIIIHHWVQKEIGNVKHAQDVGLEPQGGGDLKTPKKKRLMRNVSERPGQAASPLLLPS